VLSDVLLAAALHGGLCRAADLTALVNILRIDSMPLIKSCGVIWIELPTDSGAEAMRRWYPDPLSLACIHKLLSLSTFHLKSKPITADRCWKLISSRLASVTNTKLTMGFSGFCRSAIGVTENLPGVELPQVLVEYAIGNVSSTSLSKDHMSFLAQTEFEAGLSSDISRFKYIPSKTRVTQGRRADFDCDFSHLFKSINNALAQYQKPGFKNTPKNALAELQSISESEDIPFSVQTLLEWLMSLLTIHRQVSTVRRYFSEIGKSWLFNSMQFDFNSINVVDLENLYNSLMDDELSPAQAGYRAARIRQFHDYCVVEYEFPYLEDRILDEYGSVKASVRAGFISEALFRQLCASIRFIEGFDAETVRGLVCMLIICYRTGIRRGEALKLKLRDIESSSDMWLYVRVNRYGNNKSNNATRKIPLAILLTENERANVGE
jgi:hypothetical protein